MGSFLRALEKSDNLKMPGAAKVPVARAALQFVVGHEDAESAAWNAYIAALPPAPARTFSRFYIIACPQCCAPAGRACRSPSKRATVAHGARVKAALPYLIRRNDDGD